MMLIDNKFELSIPTHIKFTLYKFDYIDGIIISKVLRECENLNIDSNNLYKIKADSFKSAMLNNKRLRLEIDKIRNAGLSTTPDNKPNSAMFIWSILEKLHNIEWITFTISYDRTFTRLVKFEKQKILNFYFKIEEGIFDLTKLFDRESLDIINRKIIEYDLMPNEYLERCSYFYMQASFLFDILGELEYEDLLNTIDLLSEIDPKLEEDDPLFLVITDYTQY